MRSMKRVALVMMSVLALGLFAGCGKSFDASAYVKALMDNSYKNDSKAFVDMEIGSADEASKLYEEGIDAEMAGVVDDAMPEETQAAYREFFKSLLKKADYTVGEAEKEGDGFVVTVTYKQMKIFEPAMTSYSGQLESKMTEWQTAASEGTMTDEDVYKEIYQLLLDCMNDALANAEYGEEQTATVAVELVNNVYTPKTEDFTNLESAMFDIDAVNNLQ